MKNTIFVSIASYRDQLCPMTMITLYEMAANPENVYVGLCQQNDIKKDVECVFPEEHPLAEIANKNVRRVTIPHTQAKGPTYARYICASLYKGEDFFLMIDSHSLFAQDWDTHLLQMMQDLNSAGHHKVILSHYPPRLEDYQSQVDSKSYVTVLETTAKNNDGIPVFQGAGWQLPQPLPTPNFYVSANFMFAPGTIVKEVAFDPHLPFLFEGEEILYSIRAFTHGWNVFSPNKNIIFHHYTRKGEPKFWDDLSIEAKDSIRKVRFLLGIEDKREEIESPIIRNSIYKFGLGNLRPLDEFYKLTSIDISVDPNTRQVKNKNTSIIIITILVILAIIIIALVIYFAIQSKKLKKNS
jgi:hypothetical protein